MKNYHFFLFLPDEKYRFFSEFSKFFSNSVIFAIAIFNFFDASVTKLSFSFESFGPPCFGKRKIRLSQTGQEKLKIE